MDRRPMPSGTVERGYRTMRTDLLRGEQARWRRLLADLDDDVESGRNEWSYPESTREYINWHLSVIDEELAWRRANQLLKRS